jgi:hypothetical protein
VRREFALYFRQCHGSKNVNTYLFCTTPNLTDLDRADLARLLREAIEGSTSLDDWPMAACRPHRAIGQEARIGFGLVDWPAFPASLR